MNTEWVDKMFNMLNLRLGLFRLSPDSFYFEPTEEIYSLLESGDEHELQSVVIRMAEHLEISPIPSAKYEWGLMMEPEVAGRIKMATNWRHIQIPFFYVGKRYALGAILAHEMSHAFLACRGIMLPDQNENEMLTDLAAVFIGLGKLLLNGLVVTMDDNFSEAQVLGYLSQDLILHCYLKVNTYRSIRSSVVEQNLLPEIKNRITGFEKLG